MKWTLEQKSIMILDPRFLARVYRQIGLTFVYVEKWRRTDDIIFVKAIDAFKSSVNWSQNWPEIHTENVQVSVIFVLSL